MTEREAGEAIDGLISLGFSDNIILFMIPKGQFRKYW